MQNIMVVKKIKNTLVLQQEEPTFFVTVKNTLIIDTDSLATILKYLILKGFLSKKVLEGILSEINE